jgi:hypothetical protein
MKMGIANKISKVTDRYNPAIERHESGEVIFHWPIESHWDWGYTKTVRNRLASLIGIDSDMIAIRPLRGDMVLCVPANAA